MSVKVSLFGGVEGENLHRKDDMTTLIEQLGSCAVSNSELLPDLEKSSPQDLASLVFDMELSLETRTGIFEVYIRRFGDAVLEVINKVKSMYLFSQSKLTGEFIFEVIHKTSLNPTYKIECAKVLSNFSQKGYECINFILGEYTGIPTPIRLDAIYMLMLSPEYKNEATVYFKSFLVDQEVDCLYRYKAIINLETHVQDKELYLYFARVGTKTFLDCSRNMTYYRTLACQYILNKCDPDPELKTLAIDSLFIFATDNELDINLRADAVDVLLTIEDKEIVSRATQILSILGSMGRSVKSIYDNAQNVHIRSVEKSAHQILEFLNTVNLIKPSHVVDYNWVRKQIVEHASALKEEEKERVNVALTRVLIDRAFYGSFSMTLTTILCRIWAYIEDHEHFETLRMRVIEELIDASSWCSTGYAMRIVNALSGFTDFSIRISFEDQIAGNLAGRLNAVIRKIEDEDYQAQVMMEMAIPVQYYNQRGSFLKFFRESMSKIREEMYQEFREFMSDHDYDLYFRKAIIAYEGVDTF